MTRTIQPSEAGSYRIYLELQYDTKTSYWASPPFDQYDFTFLGYTWYTSPYGLAFVGGQTVYTSLSIKRYHLEQPDDYASGLARYNLPGADALKYWLVEVDLRDLRTTGVPGDAFVIAGEDDGSGGSGGGGTGGGGGSGGGGDDFLSNIDYGAYMAKFASGNPGWTDELPTLRMSRGGQSGDTLASNFAGAVLNYLDTLGNYGAASGYREAIDRVERKENLLSDYLGRAMDFTGGIMADLRRELDNEETGFRDHEREWRKAKIERLDNDAFDAGLEDLGVRDAARKLLKEFTLSLQDESTIIADFGRRFEALRDAAEGARAVIGEGVKRIKGSVWDDLIVNADDEVRDGKDKAVLGDGDDVFYDGKGRAKIDAGRGDDEIFGYGGADDIDAGAGFDVVLAGGGNDKVKTGAAADAAAGGAGRDFLSMGPGGDYGYGDDGPDRLKGGGGGDELYGGAGKDRLDGGAGKDRLEGGGGDDRLKGGGGNDKLFGGKGGDTFEFQRHAGRDWVRDFEQGEDVISVSGGKFSELRFERLGFHTVVHWKGEEMVIEGMKPRDLDRDDFVF